MGTIQWDARRRSIVRDAGRRAVRGAVLALLLCGGTAHAGLGDAKAVVATDRSGDAAQTTTTQAMPAYDRTETVAADGSSVRQFSGRDGVVFAVAFSGPTMPDLKAVLGTRYDTYVAAAKARRGSHHVVSFATDDAVITIVKLPRGFSGHAHLPSAVPTGVDVETLR